MSALNLPNLDKAAIVLCGLSPFAAETVIGMLNPEKIPRLRQLMETYRGNAKLKEMVDAVNSEFYQLRSEVEENARQYGFVAQSQDKKKALEDALEEGQETEEEEAERKAREKKKKLAAGIIDANEDPADTLKQIDSAVLARVLANEHPRAVAIALNRMESRQASEVIKRLEPEVRRETFLLMAKGLPENSGLVQKVLSAIVEICAKRVDVDTVEEGESQFQHLAEILHLVDREEKGQLLAALENTNPDAFAEIDSRLYDFTDLLKIEDRSLQKILAEIDLKIMATALYGATPTIGECVMGNISERVRTMLQEEIEFLGSVSSAKVDEARREIADVIRKHDKAETLVWKIIE